MEEEKEKKNLQETPKPDDKNFDLRNFVRSLMMVLLLGISFVILIGWGIYQWNWQNYFVNSLSEWIPYPAAIINRSNWVSLRDYNKNVESMKRFLESKEAAYKGSGFDFSTEDGLKKLAIVKKNVLNQLIENKIIILSAKEMGITVSKEELEETAKKIIARDGKEKENLNQLFLLYGWKFEDFRDRVVLNMLYREKLEEKVRKSGLLDNKAKDQVAIIEKKIKDGEDFSQIAKSMSDTPSKIYGGLLPAFSKEDTPVDLPEEIFDLAQGTIKGPISGNEGWHFIKIERKFEESEKQKIEIRHILIRKESFDSWIKEYKNKFRVFIPLKIYFWHNEMGKLFFRDEKLNKIEDDMSRLYLNEKAQQADFLLDTSNLEQNNANNNKK